MTRAPFLEACLRLLLALVLGLGPLGATLLAAGLHAPLCVCAGCGPLAPDGGCCPAGEREPSGPTLGAARDRCTCQMTAPEQSPSALVLGSPASTRARPEEFRTAHASAPAREGFEVVSAPRAPRPPGSASPPGPPGVRRQQGPARAAALGQLLL